MDIRFQSFEIPIVHFLSTTDPRTQNMFSDHMGGNPFNLIGVHFFINKNNRPELEVVIGIVRSLDIFSDSDSLG